MIIWEPVRHRYEGLLPDGRLLCILPDVLEMNRGLFPDAELFDPEEWLSSVDGENCWLEVIENTRAEVGKPILYQINGVWIEA